MAAASSRESRTSATRIRESTAGSTVERVTPRRLISWWAVLGQRVAELEAQPGEQPAVLVGLG